MKKLTAIVCIVFAMVMVLSLPAAATTPYQTYTYSKDGIAMYSPDAYTPSKTIDHKYMGLTDESFLHTYHADLGILYKNMNEARVVMEAAQDAVDEDIISWIGDDNLLATIYASDEYLLAVEKEKEGDTGAIQKVLEDAMDSDAKSEMNKDDLHKELVKALNAAKKEHSSIKNKYDVLYAELSTLSGPSDIEVDEEGNIYLADTKNDRIVVLDRYYRVKFILSDFLNAQGIADGLTEPQGVFVTADKTVAGEPVEGKIYVCDTEANRIVTFDQSGNFIDIIPAPESELFEQGSVYKPIAVAVDAYDRLYVVSSTTNKGIIVMTDEGLFTGFVGAQKVSVSAWDQVWAKFGYDTTSDNVATEFNNITINGDFIYVTTSTIEEKDLLAAIKNKDKDGDFAPVKMLNAAGDEIMRRNGFFPPSGEVDNVAFSASDTIFGASTVVDVAVGPENTWSIVDKKRSKVFTYDFDGNLLFAFGDEGRQLGNITKGALVGMCYQGDNMLLLNKTDGSFTVYARTEYGNILADALRNQNERDFEHAIEDWTEILKRNNNFDAAYIGIGTSLYREGKYEESLTYFKAAYDTTNYSNSYKEIRKEWMSKYILLIPIGVVVLCFLWVKFMAFAKKVNKRVGVTKGKKTYGQELLYVFHVIFHPFDGFWDLKHEKRGSVRAGATILGVTILAFYYQSIGQGYLLNPDGRYSSLIAVAMSVLVPLALWTVANWCLTTLFEGEGSFKDIFIATTYSLAPMVLMLIPTTIASNFVLSTEADILTLITTIGFIWTGMLIFFGMMVTHDYSMGKNVLTSLGTIAGMVVIMFIAILFSTLLGKLVSFVTNIVTELQFRM